MSTRIPALLFVLVAILAPLDHSRANEEATASAQLRLQTKAEELYASGHFERAHFIYVNELATRGDKYAQYMAGYMCLNGEGVARDPVRASAWYRLAAERGVPEFLEVRDQLLESMSEADRARSDALYVELRQEYSDLVLALRRVREDRRALSAGVTPSRLPDGATGPIAIVDPRTGESMSRTDYVARGEKLMQVRLDFITERMGIERADAGMSSREFEAFAERVRAFLAVVDDR